jgi:raffinose/stachyose/melibiose transport system substrate-binding protein
MTTRRPTLLALLATIALVVGACSQGSTPNPSGASSGAASSAPSTAAGAASGAASSAPSTAAGAAACTGTQTVTVWSWFVQNTMTKAVDAYQKSHPGVTVKYTYYNYDPEYLTALKAAAASDTLPDLIGMQPGSFTQQYRDYLVALNTYAAAAWGADWESLIPPVDKQQMALGNPAGDTNYYILPQSSQVLATWYNKDIFAKYNLSVPTTLDELIQVAKTLRANNIIPMFQGAAGAWQNENVFLMMANQVKKGITDDVQQGKADWTDPALVTAMKTWGDLFKNGVFQDGALGAQGYPTGAQLFASGKVGMITFGSWWLQEAQLPPPQPDQVSDLKAFDYFMFPAITSGSQPGAIVGGVDFGYGMTKHGASNPCAFDFLASFLNGEAGQAALADVADLPAFLNVKLPSSVSPNVSALYARFMQQLPNAVNQRWYSADVQKAVDDALQAVATGEKTPEAALADVSTVQKKALGK